MRSDCSVFPFRDCAMSKNSLPSPRFWRHSPIFVLKALNLWSIWVYFCIRCEVEAEVYLFAYEYSTVPSPFELFCMLVKNQLGIFFCTMLSCVWLFVTLWTVAHQASLSMECSRQEYWSGLSFPTPGHLPDPGIKPVSPASQGVSLLSEIPGKSHGHTCVHLFLASLFCFSYLLICVCLLHSLDCSNYVWKSSGLIPLTLFF